MKLTILIALGTTLVTLAQKPTLEPQKDWSKERTQLWLDSLVKSLTQDTKPAQNVNYGSYYNQNPPIRTEEEKQIDIENIKILADYKIKKQIDATKELDTNIEEADLIIQGSVYEIIEMPSKENDWNYKLNLRAYSILKGKGKTKDYILKCKNFAGSRAFENGYKFRLNQLVIYIVKNNEIINYVNTFGYSSLECYNWNGYRKFPNRDSLIRHLQYFKNIDTTNIFDYFEVPHDRITAESICKKENITFNEYLERVKKARLVKKKSISSLLRSESVQANPNFMITDFYPKKIRGGLGERLTIDGIGFGSSYSGDKKLRFKNANTGGYSLNNDTDREYFSNLDAVDVLSWTDTRIVSRFPSVISPSNGFGGEYAVPGSGKFIMASYSGINTLVASVTSPMSLDVEYSLVNKIMPDGTKRRDYLIRNLDVCGNPNVFQFYVDPTIKNNSTILGTIQKALKDWSDVLKIDIKLAQDANNNVLTATGGTLPNDGKSIIYFDNITDLSKVMITTPWEGFSSIAGFNTFLVNPDMAINSNINWHFSTGDTKPPIKVDFYSALIHEIGHCLGILHIIDTQTGEKELMNWFEDQLLSKNASDRLSIFSGQGKGLLAAQRQVLDSKSVVWNPNSVSNIINFSHPRDTSGCVGVSSTKFKVTIATAPGMAFKWQRFVQSASVPGWSNRDDTPGFWAGTTTPELTVIAPVVALDGTRIRCVITMPGGCVYTTNPAFLKLWSTNTITSSRIYNTTNQCTATLSAFAPCADKVGWEHWKTVYSGVEYTNNTIYWNNFVTFHFKDMPKDIILHVRLIYINGITTTLGQSYSMGGGEYFKPILTAGFSMIPNGNCSVITTLTANSNFNNFQWYYPANILPFGSLAGQPVSLSNNGTLPFYIFTTSSVNTQYKKTPWKVQSTNSCFTSSAFVTIPNWCEICSTVPSNLCSNSARQETETTEIAPNVSTKTLIYPNPTERILNIESQESIQKIVLFDIQGKEIAAYLPNEKKYVLDLQNINEGLYVVRIQTENNKVETFKVQINR